MQAATMEPIGAIRRSRLRAGALAAAALLLAACAGGPKPTLLDLKLSAASDINPDAAGRASPVVVTLYQLKSPTAFQSVDYFQLASKPDQALGDSLVASEQVVLTPGQSVTLPRELDPATQHLGVAASFRSIDQAEWRSSAKLETGKPNSFVATLAGIALALKPAGK